MVVLLGKQILDIDSPECLELNVNNDYRIALGVPSLRDRVAR